MSIFRRIATSLLFSAVVVGAVPALAQVKPGELDMVLRQMDDASAKDSSRQRRISRWDFYERVVKQTKRYAEAGLIYFVRKATSTQMGA